MIRTLLTLLSSLLVHGLCAQPLTLEACRDEARRNYPLVARYDLIAKSEVYNLSNASKGYLPQFSLSARATVQSVVTELPIQLPDVHVKGLPKDQYQVMLELKQNIWDGGEIRNQRKRLQAAAEVERERLNVDMYTLNERVDQLYFGILLLDEQLVQNRLLQEELQRSFELVTTYMANGVANATDLDAVKVEQLHCRQAETELLSLRGAYMLMLGLFIGQALSEDVVLQKPPVTDALPALGDALRPELNWYDAQRESLDVQESGLRNAQLPRLGLFVQGAYGNPGLNMLRNKFTPYYIAGVRLSWNFGSFYTLRNDKRLIDNNRRAVESNREVFLFNTRLQATQEASAIASFRALMREDEQIIALRGNIRKAAQVKVANGTLTVTEMLREITAESLARQAKALHEVQLLMNIYKLKYTTNN